MECNCGGWTTDHEVVRNKKPAGEYRKCIACGRILWNWKTDELESELLREATKEYNEICPPEN